MIAVSHDRYFLDKVAFRIFEVDRDGVVTRYEGNHGDYLKKRKAAEKPAPAARKAEPAPRPQSRPQRLKFSFREQREFDTIDQDIADLEARLAACEADIAQNATDYVKLQALSEQKQALEAELEHKTERWVYLNDLAERIAEQAAGGRSGL